MPTNRTNTPTEQNKEDNALVLYRLEMVEAAVKMVGTKLDNQDNVKKTDLVEFRDTIINRFNEIRTDMQKDIDAKADQKQVDDLRTLIKAVAGFLSSIIAGLVIYYVTTAGGSK